MCVLKFPRHAACRFSCVLVHAVKMATSLGMYHTSVFNKRSENRCCLWKRHPLPPLQLLWRVDVCCVLRSWSRTQKTQVRVTSSSSTTSTRSRVTRDDCSTRSSPTTRCVSRDVISQCLRTRSLRTAQWQDCSSLSIPRGRKWTKYLLSCNN